MSERTCTHSHKHTRTKRYKSLSIWTYKTCIAYTYTLIHIYIQIASRNALKSNMFRKTSSCWIDANNKQQRIQQLNCTSLKKIIMRHWPSHYTAQLPFSLTSPPPFQWLCHFSDYPANFRSMSDAKWIYATQAVIF